MRRLRLLFIVVLTELLVIFSIYSQPGEFTREDRAMEKLLHRDDYIG